MSDGARKGRALTRRRPVRDLAPGLSPWRVLVLPAGVAEPARLAKLPPLAAEHQEYAKAAAEGRRVLRYLIDETGECDWHAFCYQMLPEPERRAASVREVSLEEPSHRRPAARQLSL